MYRLIIKKLTGGLVGKWHNVHNVSKCKNDKIKGEKKEIDIYTMTSFLTQ
jgi:hypothetical protein